ncbi:MAG: nicotinamide-nucleotide adenylyltransferase [Candidatus Micrarchaeota archaeon]|nr:nicotinamide-nucleotide adenylyltransferase [Candidatus Micrarchaeota archaeon]
MQKKLPVALFIGRFQPFHKGHLFALRHIAKKSGRVLIAVGSAQISFEKDNPFTKGERKKMVDAVLRGAGLGRKCIVFFLTDVKKDSEWVAHVDACAPCKYDVCYSNNSRVIRLMRKAGKKTARVPFLKKAVYNATRIREIIAKEGRWKERVPLQVREKLEKIGALRRVKALFSK